MTLRPWLLIAAAALALGACGKRGALDRPPPLWGKGDPQPVRSHDQRPAPPETSNLPNTSQPLDTGKSSPVGSATTEPHAR